MLKCNLNQGKKCPTNEGPLITESNNDQKSPANTLFQEHLYYFKEISIGRHKRKGMIMNILKLYNQS